MPDRVYIPAYIKVHLGKPDEDAEDVEVPFLTYIKNVASSEIYPTWPENAIRANMYAQASFALNRIFSEFYRTKGYDFDITSLPDYDQAYVHNRSIFGPMENIGNDLFGDYIVREGFVEPLFARYCDGRTSTCPSGMSQWGTVDLAKQGMTPTEILQHYYGNDIRIVENAPIYDIQESYPGYPVKKGDRDGVVARIQNELKRVSSSYPSIPRVEANGIFDDNTENAVKAFQKVFGLTVDGIVGKNTWYKLLYIYNAVKKLAEVHSEGIQLKDIPKEFERTLVLGDTGKDVDVVQFFLNNISIFNPAVPSVQLTSTMNPETQNSIKNFQTYVGLPPTGEVDRATFDRMYDEYRGIVLSHNTIFQEASPRPFPGYPLRLGSTGADVITLQLYLLAIKQHYPQDFPLFRASGFFGELTEGAVRAFQKKFGLQENGIVDKATWDRITQVYADIRKSPQPAGSTGPVPFVT